MKRQQGLVSILGVLALLIIGLLAVGSYFRIQEQKALEPSPTPTPFVVNVDKSDYEEGIVLVSFKGGTKYGQATEIVSGFGLTVSQPAGIDANQELAPTTIFRVIVEPGSEQSAIQNLLTNSQVSAATLSYK